MQAVGELQGLDDARIVQLRRPPIFRDEGDAVGDGPQRQEFRQLGVKADAGQDAILDAGQRLVDLGDLVPVGDIDVIHGQASIRQSLVVDEEHDAVEELRDAVDFALNGDLGERRIAVLAHVDVHAVDALGQRDDRAAHGIGAQDIAAHVDHVRRIAAGDGRQELLLVQRAFGDVQLDVRIRRLELIDTHGSDLVGQAEAHHVQRAGDFTLRCSLERECACHKDDREQGQDGSCFGARHWEFPPHLEKGRLYVRLLTGKLADNADGNR